MKNFSICTNQESKWAPPKYKCTALLVHQPTHSVSLTLLKYNNNTVQFRLCFVAVSYKMASEQQHQNFHSVPGGTGGNTTDGQ